MRCKPRLNYSKVSSQSKFVPELTIDLTFENFKLARDEVRAYICVVCTSICGSHFYVWQQFICVYIYIYICRGKIYDIYVVYLYVYLYIYLNVYMCIHNIYMCGYLMAKIHINTYTYVVYICMYKCVYMYVYMCIYMTYIYASLMCKDLKALEL